MSSSAADQLDLNAAAAADPQTLAPPPKRPRGRPKKASLPPPPPPPEAIAYPSPFPAQAEAKEGFAAGDLVWGKVRSHPWWPGQLFDAAAASEMAGARRREGSFLVAYFGDKTFAWNDAAALRSYAAHFPKMARQGGGAEEFASAVDASLAEVARRVQAAMACRCVDVEGVRGVAVENAGIREGTSAQAGDCSVIVNSFVPGRFLEFVQDLASNPGGSIDRLELVVARAHLKAFDRSRGFPDPPEFGFENGQFVVPPVVEVAKKTKADVGSNSTPSKRRKKRKRNLEEEDSDSDWEPRKRVTDSDSDTDSDWRTSNRKGSAARGRPKKGSVRKTTKTEKDVPMEYPSANEMLSQLDLVAADPIEGYDFVPVIVSFFSKYKDSLVPSSYDDKELSEVMGGKKGRRKSASLFSARKAEDSYWSDIVVSDFDDGHVSSDSGGRKRKRGSQNKRGNKKMEEEEETPMDGSVAAAAAPPPITSSDMSTEALTNNLEEKLGTGPTALVLYFSNADAIPSEGDLNSIFSIYGSVMEGETEIFKKLRTAKVVFTKRSDAEAAYSSAGKYSIFGPALLSYELSYLPSPLIASQISQAKPAAFPIGGASSDAPAQQNAP